MSIKKFYSIGIPEREGFIGRKCTDAKCARYFKIHKGLSSNTKIICPYCGVEKPIDSTHTFQQIHYAQEVAKEELFEDLSKSFQGMLASSRSHNSSGWGISMSVQHTPYRKQFILPPKEKSVDSSFQCSECDSKFQVYGIFGYCPVCSYGDIKIYDANLSSIQRSLRDGVKQPRAIRTAYYDIVSVFENFCKKYLDDVETSSFQDLRAVSSKFKERGVDIYKNINQKDQLIFRRVFATRHVYMHNAGVIDRAYVRLVPEDKKMLGQKAQLSVQAFNQCAQILRVLVDNLLKYKHDADSG